MAKVCDCFPQLKEITDARERRYRADPEKPAPEGPQSFVEVKVTSIGGLNELVECKRSGFKFVISEPAHVGGQNCREIERLAFAGCPGINTLRAPVPVETRLEVTRSKTEQAA